MIFHIRFSFPGCCFSCNCSAAVLNLSCRSSSGIHFRAVGLLIPKSRAHFDTLPSGCSAYQASTCFCCVGAPSRLMYGLSVVNLVGIFILQDAEKRLSAGHSPCLLPQALRQQKDRQPGTHGRVFAGVAVCVRRESAVANGQEQNGLI